MDYIRKFKVKTTDEADAFLKSLSVQVQKKIAFNVMKAEAIRKDYFANKTKR